MARRRGRGLPDPRRAARPRRERRASRVPSDAPSCASTRARPAPRPGEVYRREKAEAAREAMRRRLVGARLLARARSSCARPTTPRAGGMDLVFQVDTRARGRSLEAARRASSRRKLVSRGARPRARGRRVERQPRGGRRADREPAAQPRPSRRAACARARAARQRRGRRLRRCRPGRDRACRHASSCAGPTRCCSPACARSRAAPLDDAALAEDARLLAPASRRSATSRPASSARCRRAAAALPVVFRARPGPRAVVRAVDGREPAAAALRRRAAGPRSCALRDGQPYRLARRRQEPRRAACPPGAAPATSTSGSEPT